MQVCPQCGSDLDDAPEGLCPSCLARGLLATDPNEEGDSATETATATLAEGGDRFGPYRILRPLGEGGMGTVYLALQETPIRRRVALKVVKQGMDSADVLARFHRERQSLALMEHGSIARILDAGASANGRPYFVMEYVDGVPITRYCDKHRLNVRSRLGLFLAVCRAVHHAHQKGVIHRDLKPSNVLVAEQDGKPVPKIIDFGIAKPKVKLGFDDTTFTQLGQMVGTPLYASPEQSDVMSGEVGAASDVYSLGVMLYELLVGSVPFDAARFREGGLAEMLRIIREEDPPSLLSKLTGPDSDSGAIAARRDTNPTALRRLVERDLDWITRKALEKLPARRYPSVSDLASDIERFLDGRPVMAAPPSAVYRISKLAGRHRLAVAVCATALLAFPAGWLGFKGHAPKLTGRDTIVVANFANSTGDSVFDDTLRQGLIAQLTQSPYLRIQPEPRIHSILRQMNQSPEAKLTPELAREVCVRIGSAAVVDGSIAALGSQYVLNLGMRDCRTGEMLDQDQAQAARKEEVLGVLSGMASRLRSRAGESLATLDKHSAPLEATTSSLEALKAYSDGQKAHAAGKLSEGLRLFERAVELDPNFALAHAAIGQSYETTDEFERAGASFRKAYELRDRVTDNERFFLTALYQRSVTGDMEKARLTCELWAQTYPREPAPQSYLAGMLNGVFARYEAGSECARKAIALDPDFSYPYYNLSRNLMRLEKRSEAEAAMALASKRGLVSQESLLQEYDLAFLRRDEAGMQSALTRSRERPEAEGLVSYRHALTLAYQGKLQNAGSLIAQSSAIDLRAGNKERGSGARTVEALWQAFFENAAAVRKLGTPDLASSAGREMNYVRALTLAMIGDSVRSRELAEELARRYPEDTSVQFYYLPVLRARLALNAGDSARAIEALEKARPTELGMARLDGFALIGALYPCFFRGQAYLAAGRPAEAAAEFQKILDHPGSVVSDPVGPAARVQLARAWLAAGDRAKAQAAYRDFFELWRNADPAAPLLSQARKEASRIR